jgi:hypothetical protein
MTPTTIERLAKRLFTSTYRGGDFKQSGVAVFMADVAWGGSDMRAVNNALARAGQKRIAKQEQPSGRLTDATVAEINAADPDKFLDAYYEEMRGSRTRASESPGQAKWLGGWLNRLGTRYVQAKILIGNSAGAAKWLEEATGKERSYVLSKLTPKEKVALMHAAKEELSLGPESNLLRAVEPQGANTETTKPPSGQGDPK